MGGRWSPGGVAQRHRRPAGDPLGAVARLLPDAPRAQPDAGSARDVDLIRAAVAMLRAREDALVVVDDGHSLDDLPTPTSVS